LLDVDQNACIRGFLLPESRPDYYENICSAGVYLLSPALLNRKKAPDRADLDRDVLAPAAKTGTLFAYRSSEYVRDMGTPQRLAAVEEDVRRGIVCRKHLKRPQRTVFLDRDGTINRYKGYITSPKELELLPGAAAAVKRINALGYLAILATNQPVIARGECSPEQLRQIHNKMETLLGDGGAYLDAI
jgi:D-glycero-D-manno-heptose 1,7-bisphosphate phosphatase